MPAAQQYEPVGLMLISERPDTIQTESFSVNGCRSGHEFYFILSGLTLFYFGLDNQ